MGRETLGKNAEQNMDIRVCSPSKTTGKRSCCVCTPETTPATTRSSRIEEGSNPPGPAWKCFGAMLRISTALGLESLPQEWPCLPQPPQKGLETVFFPQKISFMEVVGLKDPARNFSHFLKNQGNGFSCRMTTVTPPSVGISMVPQQELNQIHPPDPEAITFLLLGCLKKK